MAENSELPGIQISALNELTELVPDAPVFIPVIDMTEASPANRNKRANIRLFANASTPDPELGNVFRDKVSIEKTAAHDGGHLQLVNPDITGKPNGEQRVELVLHSSGVLTLRNVTHEPIVITSGNFLHNNFILDDDGNLTIRGTITANGVELGAGGTGGSTLAVFNPLKLYAYNATQPELVLHTVDGKLRIWTLKNTPDTNTPQTRSAPSYATNSQWIDVGKDVFESTAQSTIFEEYKAQPGNENKTWADFQAAITGPQGPIGPVGPASTVPGPIGPAGPASTVPGPVGYTPQKGIDYFDGAKGDNGIIAWLQMNPGKTLADYNQAFKGEQGEQGEGALFYRVQSVLPNTAALPVGPANERDAYIIEDAGGVPHIWLWLPGPAEWYDLGVSSQVQLPAEPVDPALLDVYALKAGDTFTGLVRVEKNGAHDNAHLQLANPLITGKKNNETRAELVMHNNGVLSVRNVTHEPIVFVSGNHLHNNFTLDDNGNGVFRGNVWANGVLLGQPAPPEGVKWLSKPETPIINGTTIPVGAGSLDNAGTAVNIPAKTLTFAYSGPNTERYDAIAASITNPSEWVRIPGPAFPVGGEAVFPVVPANQAALTYMKIGSSSAEIESGSGGATVVQDKGQSTLDVMSQKAVTDALNAVTVGGFPGFVEERFTSTPYTTLQQTSFANIWGVFWNTVKQRKPTVNNADAPDYRITVNANGTATINATPEVTGGAGEIVYVALAGTVTPPPPEDPTKTTPAASTFNGFNDTDNTITVVPATGVPMADYRYLLPNDATVYTVPGNGIINVGNIAGSVTVYSIATSTRNQSPNATSPAFTTTGAEPTPDMTELYYKEYIDPTEWAAFSEGVDIGWNQTGPTRANIAPAPGGGSAAYMRAVNAYVDIYKTGPVPAYNPGQVIRMVISLEMGANAILRVLMGGTRRDHKASDIVNGFLTVDLMATGSPQVPAFEVASSGYDGLLQEVWIKSLRIFKYNDPAIVGSDSTYIASGATYGDSINRYHSGSWTQDAWEGYSDGHDAYYTNQPGSFYVQHGTATQTIKVYSIKSPSMGVVHHHIDGVFVGAVDCYAPTTQFTQLIATYTVAPGDRRFQGSRETGTALSDKVEFI